MSKVIMSPVAASVPFDNTTPGAAGIDANETQTAIEKVFANASGPKGRLPVVYWEFSTNANNYLYYGGQTKSNETPFVSGNEAIINEIAVAGRVNSANSNVLWTIYRIDKASIPTTGTITPNFGSLASVVNQGLTWHAV